MSKALRVLDVEPEPEVDPLELKEAQDLELELFEQYEMELFLDDMLLHCDIAQEETLQALQMLFYSGALGTNWLRGCTPVESAYQLYKGLEEKRYKYTEVKKILLDAVHLAARQLQRLEN